MIKTTSTPGPLDLTDAALDQQVRSKARVRDLAEVFTHQREVDAILDQFPHAFTDLDAKFLEPACGSGNFLVEILRRKLRLVTARATTLERYEHELLRAIASIYGIDISPDNIAEAHHRLAQTLADHHGRWDVAPPLSDGFWSTAQLILDANIVVGDTLAQADRIELCDWRHHDGQRFQRVWSHALIPPADRDLFWSERIQDPQPIHYRQLQPAPTAKPRRRATATR